MSQLNEYDGRANPFEDVSCIKEINILNQFRTKIRIDYEVEPQRDNIESVTINRENESRNNENNDKTQDYYKKNLNSNDIENISQNNQLSEITKTNYNENKTKSNKSNENVTEVETTNNMNGGISGSYTNSQQNADSDMEYNRNKKGGGGNLGYNGAGIGVNYEQENEEKKANSSNNESSKDISGSVSVAKGSSNKNMQKQLSSNSNEQNNTNTFDIKDVNNNISIRKHKDDISIDSEQKDSITDKYNRNTENKSKFNATVTYRDNDVEQYKSGSIEIQHQSMGTIKMTVRDKSSLIYLTIYIARNNTKYIKASKNKPVSGSFSDNNSNNQWDRCCERRGCDEGLWVLDAKLSLNRGSDELRKKIQISNDKKSIAGIDRNAIMIKNKNTMNNQWLEDDVCEWIKYLSRKYGANNIDLKIANKMEKQEIRGSTLWSITKCDLRDIIQDKNATNIIFNELDKLRNGEKSIPTANELKEIFNWDEDIVKMYIGTIYNGKYLKHIRSFKTTNGSDLLQMDTKTILKTEYNIQDPGEREEIWAKIQDIQQNKHVPKINDIISGYKKLQKPKAEGYLDVPELKRINGNKKHRAMIVLGQTGAGKTTLLNSMVNYLWNVDFEDKFRYRLIDEDENKIGGQAHSMTQTVNAYYLYPPALDYQLTVIDTPGFGDSRGIERDQKIKQELSNFFKTKVQQIDAICIVIRAPQARLTPTQKYIFNQVLGIFGNDIRENIFILLTFADGKKPPALAALEADKIPYQKYIKLNNSAFGLEMDDMKCLEDDDHDDQDNEFDSLYWSMGIKSFKRLFEALDNVKPKSLILTNRVTDRREELEIIIANIKPRINTGYTILTNMRKQIECLKEHEGLIEQSKDYKIEETEQAIRKIYENVKYTTACTVCQYTCHAECTIKSDNKSLCKSIAFWSGKCRVCPNKCHFSKHKMLPYKIETYFVTRKRTITELKNQYNDAKNEKDGISQIIDELAANMVKAQQDLYKSIKDIHCCTNELNKIALRPRIPTPNDYIDILIETEKQERDKNPDWLDRIKTLQNIKESNKIFDEINKKQFSPWNGYEDVLNIVDEKTGGMISKMVGFHTSNIMHQEQKLNEDENDDEKDEEKVCSKDLDELLTLNSGGNKPQSFKISRRCALLSKFVTNIDKDKTSIDIIKVSAETLQHVIEYLKHHKGESPAPLPCPVRSIHMEEIVSDQWDAKWINQFDKKTIFELILAADIMKIESLLNLGCGKIATLIKQLDQKEINRIIEEEEEYRRQHNAGHK